MTILGPEPVDGWRDNPDHSRAYVPMPFGIACYERTGDRRSAGFLGATRWTYTHRGSVATADEAEQWLRGETPAGLIRIF